MEVTLRVNAALPEPVDLNPSVINSRERLISEQNLATCIALDGLIFSCTRRPAAENWSLRRAEMGDIVAAEKGDIATAEMGDIVTAEMGDIVTAEMGDIATAEMGDIVTAEIGDIVAAEKGNIVTAEMGDIVTAEMGDIALKRFRYRPTTISFLFFEKNLFIQLFNHPRVCYRW